MSENDKQLNHGGIRLIPPWLNQHILLSVVCHRVRVYKLAVTCERTRLVPYCIGSTLEAVGDLSVIACFSPCDRE